MNHAEIRASRLEMELLLAELERRHQEPSLRPSPKMPYQGLSPKQLACKAHASKRKALGCGRRAGKTTLAADKIIDTVINFPGSIVPIVETTKTAMSTQVLWDGLIEECERRGLEYKSNEQLHRIKFPKYRSALWFIGADQPRLADRLRGGGFPLLFIDEAGTFRPLVLKHLLDDIIEPAMMDHDGEIWMAGTPGEIPQGPFYDTSLPGSGWEYFCWTALDNPGVPHAEAWLAEMRKRKGWDDNNPSYRREWLGEWVVDADATVYQWKAGRNTGKWDGQSDYCVMGVDLGYSDSTAFTVLHVRGEEIFVTTEFKEAGLIPSSIAARLEQFKLAHNPRVIVVDAGGLGKGYVEEFRQRWALPVLEAEKTKKRAYIDMMNGEFRSGLLHVSVQDCPQLVEEMQLLQWDDPRTKLKMSDKYDNHLTDALLYAWRYARTTAQPREKYVDPNSSEWFQLQEAERKRRYLAKVRARKEKKFWE